MGGDDGGKVPPAGGPGVSRPPPRLQLAGGLTLENRPAGRGNQVKLLKRSRSGLVILTVWLGLLLLSGPAGAAELSEYGNPFLWVTVGRGKVKAEAVRTPEKLYRGLGYRKELPAGRGMLFFMPLVTVQDFCMRGMQFPIDIIWIFRGKVVGLEANVSPQFTGTLSSPRPVNVVLEVPGGFAEKSGIRVGDQVSW
jgi:uncharacterized membrane protein (UPF0127 family)